MSLVKEGEVRKNNNNLMMDKKIVDEVVELMREKKRLNTDDPREKLRYGIAYHMHTGDVLTRRPIIDWNSFFTKNKCPVCGDLISLKGEAYECPKCMLTIPLDIYDNARKRHEEEREWRKENRRLNDKIREMKLSEKQTRELYQTATKRAIEEPHGRVKGENTRK